VREDESQQFAKTRLRHGELELRFDRAEAPRRGLHRLGVRYQTVLAAEAGGLAGQGGARVRFDLPGWEAGLDRAEVRWLVPAGAQAVADPAVAQELSEGPREQGKHTLRFVRVHVPRATPWSVAVDVPGKGARRPGEKSAAPSARGAYTGLWLALSVLAFAWLVRSLTRRAARAEGHLPLALGPTRLRRGLRACAWLVAALGWPLSALLGSLALLGLALSFADRYDSAARPLSLGRFVPLTHVELRRAARGELARRLWGAPVTDLASLSGFSLVLLGLFGLARAPGAFDMAGDPWGVGAACALVCFACSSRFSRPRAVVEQLGLLARTARTLLAVGAALRLCWYVPAEGGAREPRLRLLPAARYPGLLRVELSADTRRDVTPLVLMVVVEADSPVDLWVSAFAPEAVRELSSGGRRAVHLWPVTDPTETLDALLARLASESQRACDAQLVDPLAA
jgi:hypothetical protein